MAEIQGRNNVTGELQVIGIDNATGGIIIAGSGGGGGGGVGGATEATLTAINSNVADIETAVNGLGSNLGTTATNTGTTATNTGTIATNTGTIATNTGTVATNTDTIATNTGTIATNTGLINTVSGTIATNTGTTATNTGTTATNTGTIVTNTGLIKTVVDSVLSMLTTINNALQSFTSNWGVVSGDATVSDPQYWLNVRLTDGTSFINSTIPVAIQGLVNIGSFGGPVFTTPTTPNEVRSVMTALSTGGTNLDVTYFDISELLLLEVHLANLSSGSCRVQIYHTTSGVDSDLSLIDDVTVLSTDDQHITFKVNGLPFKSLRFRFTPTISGVTGQYAFIARV